jgi:hypothetical protein
VGHCLSTAFCPHASKQACYFRSKISLARESLLILNEMLNVGRTLVRLRFTGDDVVRTSGLHSRFRVPTQKYQKATTDFLRFPFNCKCLFVFFVGSARQRERARERERERSGWTFEVVW